MKKQILSAIGAALATCLVLLLVVWPFGETPPATTAPTQTTGISLPGTTVTVPTPSPTQPTTLPWVPPTTLPTPPETTVAPPETTVPEAPGVVRLYTCDARLHGIYVELAAEFYAKTGTEVIVLAPAQGNCEETLTQLLASDTPPTVFCIHSQQMLENLQEDLLDLGNSQAAKALCSPAFGAQENGKVLALAANVSATGLLYNASMLAAGGWGEMEIVNFAAFSNAVTTIMQYPSHERGYPFTAPDFADAALMEDLAGLFADSDQLRSFVDLYRKNSTSKTTTLNYFLKGTTVFYIGNTDDYSLVSDLGSTKLRFMPAYAQGSSAVQYVCDHYWAVSGRGSGNDRAAAVAFLDWLVTDQDGSVPADRLELLAPYRDASFAANVLQRNLRVYLDAGDARVSWKESGAVSDVSGFTSALQAYIAAPNDENWARVAELFHT